MSYQRQRDIIISAANWKMQSQAKFWIPDPKCNENQNQMRQWDGIPWSIAYCFHCIKYLKFDVYYVTAKLLTLLSETSCDIWSHNIFARSMCVVRVRSTRCNASRDRITATTGISIAVSLYESIDIEYFECAPLLSLIWTVQLRCRILQGRTDIDIVSDRIRVASKLRIDSMTEL